MNFTKEFTPIEKSQMKLSITVQQSEVQNQYDTLTKKYSKQLQIPGFRKGKVPVKILEQKFGESLRAETYNHIIESALQEAFENTDKYQRPLPYSQPELDGTPDFKLENDMVFTVVYDVLPKAELTKLEGFTVKIPEVTISDADIEKELKLIQERNALVIDCADGDAVQNDSIVTVNYTELDEQGAEVAASKREGFVFTVGKGQFRYELDNEVIGMKKGEEKTVSHTYPQDHIDEQLAGKTITLKIAVTALKRKELPAIDDDLAQDVSEKYKTLADLKADISKNLNLKVQDELEQRKNNSLLQQMAEANPFDLPESMINAELEARWMMMAQQFRMSPEELEKLTAAINGSLSKESAREEWRPEAIMRLKTRIIVEKLIEERNISASPEDVEAEYTAIAERVGSTAADVKKHYDGNLREKEYIVDSIKEKKLYTQLFEKSTVETDKKLSMEELFNKETAHAGKDA
ncbi:MAG: trigger factor [Treponema sp.]